MSGALRAPASAAEWEAYHRIRRLVLFELRGRGDAYDPDHPDEHRPGHHPLVYHEGNEAVGVLRVDIRGEVAIFRRVAILPERQRRGLGRRMLAEAEAFARAQGCVRVDSFVDAEAVGFYRRCGYTFAGAEAHAGATVPMTKPLPG